MAVEEIKSHKYTHSPLPVANHGEETHDIFIPNGRKLVTATVRVNDGRWSPTACIVQQPAYGVVGPRSVQFKVRWAWLKVPLPNVTPNPTDRETFIDYDVVAYVEPTVPVVTGEQVRGHLIAYEHANFRGRHRHIFNSEADLAHGDDSSMSMAISSIIVVSGTWAFYQNANYDTVFNSEFGPGMYAQVSDYGVSNDAIRSLKCVG